MYGRTENVNDREEKKRELGGFDTMTRYVTSPAISCKSDDGEIWICGWLSMSRSTDSVSWICRVVTVSCDAGSTDDECRISHFGLHYVYSIYAIADETPSIKIGCRCKKEHRRGRSKAEEINVESLYHSMYSILENYFLRNSNEREGKSDPTWDLSAGVIVTKGAFLSLVTGR